MCATDFTAPSSESAPVYDLRYDAALISQSIAKQYGILPSEQEDMAYSDWSLLVAGLMEDTPLGRVVSIRCESDPSVLRQMTPEQRKIRSDWAAFRSAHRSDSPADENVIRAQMAQLQQALKSAFSRKGE